MHTRSTYTPSSFSNNWPLALVVALGGTMVFSSDGVNVHQVQAADQQHPVDEPAVLSRSVYARLLPSVCKVIGVQSGLQGTMRPINSGSGFIVSQDGIVVTNNHVIAAIRNVHNTKFKLQFDDGRVYYADVVASDEGSDIGVLKIRPRFPEETFTPVLKGDSDKLVPGDAVTAVGCPLGGRLSFSSGVLSSKYYGADDRIISTALPLSTPLSFLQFDAGIAGGNSGGPLVDRNGNVVGVACAAKGGIGVPTGAVYLGIAINDAWPIVEHLTTRGKVQRAWLGLRVSCKDRLEWDQEIALNRSLAQQVAPFPPHVHSGLLVEYVLGGGPARKAGLQPGDVIFSVNGNNTVFKGDLFAAVGPVYEPQRKMTLEVFRPATSTDHPKGQILQIEVLAAPFDR